MKIVILLLCLSPALVFATKEDDTEKTVDLESAGRSILQEEGPPVLVSLPLLREQQADLDGSEFVFNLLDSKPTVAPGGLQFSANRNSFRALGLSNGRNGGGGTQVFFKFEPCGFRAPHLHPRGTENFYVVGGNVRANFIREDGRLVVNDVRKGFAGFFPEGYIHFLQNVGCEPAETLSVFDTSDEGVIDIATALRFPRDTIQTALGNRALTPVDEVIEVVLTQSEDCLKRCRLSSNFTNSTNGNG